MRISDWSSDVCSSDLNIDAAILEGDVALLVARPDDDHFRADRRPRIKMPDILVHHADATGRHVVSDCPGLVRAVDAEDRVAATLVEIHGAGAERVVDGAFDRKSDVTVKYESVRVDIGSRRIIKQKTTLLLLVLVCSLNTDSI